MIILTLRTDKPEAEIGLYDDALQMAGYAWQAHRQLAESLHQNIQALLEKQGLSLDELSGVAVFKGPGSFTGLRIGLSAANALADSLGIPIVGATGEDWAKRAVMELMAGGNQKAVMPEYGSEPHVTQPRK